MTLASEAKSFIPGPTVRGGLYMLISIIVSVVFILNEPEIIEDSLDSLSYGMFTRLGSQTFYPDNHPATNTSMVVLIDQNSLSDTDEKWPLPFSFHASLIERIIAGKPKAIVLDYLFVDERDDKTIEDLKLILDYANTIDIPIITARGSYAMYPEGIIPSLAPYVTLASGWRGEGPPSSPFHYNLTIPRYSIDEYKESNDLFNGYLAHYKNSFPRSNRTPDNLLENQSYIDSPAIAAYRVYCKDNLVDNNCDLVNETHLPQTNIDREMWVLWSSRAPDNVKGFNLKPDEPFNAVKCYSITDNSIAGSVIDVIGGAKNTCGPQLMLPANYLIKDMDQRIEDAIKDRVVFIGLNLEGIQDYIKPPNTAGAIPGVYMHAMAYENLVLMGKDYFSFSSNNNWAYFLNADLFEIVTLFALFILYFCILNTEFTFIRKWDFKSFNKKNTTDIETDSFSELFQYCYNPFNFLSISKTLLLKLFYFLFDQFILGLILIFVCLYIQMFLFKIAPVNFLSLLGLTGAYRLGLAFVSSKK